MHPSAIANAKSFFETYGSCFSSEGVKIVEIGSQDVNGSLRSCCSPGLNYIGVDFVAGRGVDIVLDDPYVLPFEDKSVDVVISSSCFEHSEMFWVLFLEIMRILKADGVFYLNVPSNGNFHRYPVDCWRFYPDSGVALVNWAKRNGYTPALLESYISSQISGAGEQNQWNDCVAVFLKDEACALKYPRRILDNKVDFENGLRYGEDKLLNYHDVPEDRRKLAIINRIVNNELVIR